MWYVSLGTCAGRLICDLTVLQYHKSGNAHYTECCGKLGVVVYVDLTDNVFGMLSRDLLKNGSYHTAGTAPVCVEIKKHGLIGCFYFIEI